jgi:hypothetical protein
MDEKNYSRRALAWIKKRLSQRLGLLSASDLKDRKCKQDHFDYVRD